MYVHTCTYVLSGTQSRSAVLLAKRFDCLVCVRVCVCVTMFRYERNIIIDTSACSTKPKCQISIDVDKRFLFHFLFVVIIVHSDTNTQERPIIVWAGCMCVCMMFSMPNANIYIYIPIIVYIILKVIWLSNKWVINRFWFFIEQTAIIMWLFLTHIVILIIVRRHTQCNFVRDKQTHTDNTDKTNE